MNEKTKKILKVSAIALGEMALLTLGFAVGACSAKAGTKQQTAITTPVAKSLIQKPKKATAGDILGTWEARTNETINVATYLLGKNFDVYFVCDGIEYDGIHYLDYATGGGGGGNIKANLGGYVKKPKNAISINPPSERYAYLYFSRGIGDTYNLAYGSGTGWHITSDITILSVDYAPDSDSFLYLQELLETYYTKTTPVTPPSSSESSSSEPVTSEPETSSGEPTPLPEIKEKVVLNSSYDFRRWFGNVDPTTGAIQFKLPTGISLYSVRVGGLEWENLGNERIYNCIEFTLQPLNASNALAVSDNLAKTAQNLYGDKYNEFCMLSGVYYSYQSGYDGTYTVIQDSALPSVDYRDRIYSMPMVSAQLDGTANNVNALDIRNCVIPSIYRSFGIIEDSGVIFSTNGYSSVTLRQLLGMDFSSVVNYSEGTASAFSLLTQAFGSVAGLLAVQVLPNITLGLLLFLPLIAAVIVLIIKAVKK